METTFITKGHEYLQLANQPCEGFLTKIFNKEKTLLEKCDNYKSAALYFKKGNGKIS